MLGQEDWIPRINSRIEQFVQEHASILTDVSPLLEPFTTFSRDFLSGGKRFRALCVLLGYTTVHETVPDHVIDIASALEIFHAAALVHDDIMDKSDTRRGAPSAHRRFENIHRTDKWDGSAEHFGQSAALLLGDLLLAWSDQLMSSGAQAEPNRHSAQAARNEFDRMRVDVTAGQYLDIVEENAWPTVDKLDALSRAQQVVIYKSAKYSIEAPLVIGAAIGGASEEHIRTLREFGLPLGIAFQLRDDMLGVFGDPEVTGKPAGDDLREGKRTVLIALAQQELPTSAMRFMDELLGNPDLDDAQIRTLQETLKNTGAVEKLEAIISEQIAGAQLLLDTSGFSSNAQSSLRELSHVVSRRQA